MNLPDSTDKLHVNLFADLCANYGLRKLVISPGSRNAPLILAFHHQPEIDCYVVPDERSAAYFAIGIAQYTGQPVGLLCTSGTAALNYTPAMAEAYYQQLPLVAITADRPSEWVDQLDGQTINQTNIYGNFTVYQAQLPVEAYSQNEVWYIGRLVRDGFRLLSLKNKPIHFNVPLREPLYNLAEKTKSLVKPAVYDAPGIVSYDNRELQDNLRRFSKIILVFGMNRPDALVSRLIGQITSQKNVVVFYETLSNIVVEGAFQTSDVMFSALHNKPVETLLPELVISFGDILLSKPLKQWIRSLKNTERWIVSESEMVPDVFQGVERIINLQPENFLRNLLELYEPKGTAYVNEWYKIYQTHDRLQVDYSNAVPWSDMLVFRILSQQVPGNSMIHLGNSSPVRYAQFFKWKEGIKFFGNRGTAGIDGTTSTALGMASQTDELVTLITGDVSFLYDSNALWNKYKRQNFKIVVINNRGGNIFSLIPGPDSTGLLNDYFTMHNPVSMEYLCKAYGISYYLSRNEQELTSELEHFYSDPICSLIEVQTDPTVNTQVWKDYFTTIKNKLHYE